jgi:signal transduction histidine kinase
VSAKILNVNDRAIPRYVNEQLLQREGFVVVSVDTGEEALAALDASIDLVLLDVQLPGVDGFDVCRRIKANPATANVAVLLSSSTFVSSHNKVTGLDSGADGYLVQPFEASELIATIRALLRTRAAERRASALADELGRAMEVRDEFLAMLGHELRNPIGTISTALQLLDTDADPAVRERCVGILRRQTHNLARIVDDLLDVARITRGKVALALQVVDLFEVLERCREAMGTELLGVRHGVTVELAGERLHVHGDPVRVEQIVTNLLTNALKYTPGGGRVALHLARRGDRAVVRVADTGIGMDGPTLARVFDVFAQGKQGLDRSRGGLGLGLTVVRRLVELHGGSITAASDGEGRGSTFELELPLASPAAARSPDGVPAANGLAHLRVLVVEDNGDARESLALLLRRHCGVVATEADGRAGLDRVVREPFDVMLVDIGLPSLDGYEIARQVVERLGKGRPLLVAMTGYGQPEDRRRALEVGFDLHLIKPLSVDALVLQLAQLVKTAPRRAPAASEPESPSGAARGAVGS